MKVLLGINTLTEVSTLVFMNHLKQVFRLGRHTNIELILYTPRRMSIDRMRNSAGKFAIEYGCDYLWFVDDDILLSDETLQSLLSTEGDIVQAITFVRSTPFKPMIFEWVDAARESIQIMLDWEKKKDENGLIKCDGVGFSCCIIKVDILKKVQEPWFVTGPHNTEDVYFCIKAQDAIPEIKILTDCRVPTGHLGEPQIVHMMTVEKLRKEHEVEIAPAADRGQEYNEKCQKLFG